MKWWYEPLEEKYFHYCDFYEDCLDEIVSLCRFKMDNHNVPNYYIYNDDGLFDIIKGSEIDPLSICRYSDDCKNNGVNLSEVKDTFLEEYKRLKAIVRRQYKRTPEQLIEIAEKINEIQGNALEMELAMFEEKMLIKEFEVKYDYGNLLRPYVKRTFEYEIIENPRDMDNISSIMSDRDLFDICKLTEEHSYVIAIKGNSIIGIYELSKGTDSNCYINPRMVFKFLLLVGANAFILIHNHPNGEAKMSLADFNVTKTINEAASFMEMEFIDHIIFGKDSYKCIKADVIEEEQEIVFN